MALMSTPEFQAECAQRRIDYDRLFGERRTPQWLKKFEDQVLDEALADLNRFDDPTWRRVFEMRRAAEDARRAIAHKGDDAR